MLGRAPDQVMRGEEMSGGYVIFGRDIEVSNIYFRYYCGSERRSRGQI